MDKIQQQLSEVGISTELPPKSILGGNFILKKKLGKGAFGEIFLGVQKHNNKKVAIKIESLTIKFP